MRTSVRIIDQRSRVSLQSLSPGQGGIRVHNARVSPPPRHVPPDLSGRVRKGALRCEPAALYRPGNCPKRARRRERAEFFLEYFAEHPCTDCGETDPVVLEFDHVGEKNFDIGKGFESFGWQRILDEIEACEVVCVHCHRRRTCRRAGNWRAVLTGLMDADEGAGGGSRTRAESLEGSSAAVTPHPPGDASVEPDGPRTDKGPGEPGPPPCL
jgi:hypothetical protein